MALWQIFSRSKEKLPSSKSALPGTWWPFCKKGGMGWPGWLVFKACFNQTLCATPCNGPAQQQFWEHCSKGCENNSSQGSIIMFPIFGANYHCSKGCENNSSQRSMIMFLNLCSKPIITPKGCDNKPISWLHGCFSPPLCRERLPK